jgi:RNA polymerase-binding transcription factor DksA
MTVLSARTTPTTTALSSAQPDARLQLEDLWRQQVATIVELSRDTLTPHDRDGSHATELLLTNELLAAARQQLGDTEAALTRVKDGLYGRCEDCSRQINPERLEILPAARYCVACQAARNSRR